MIDLACVGGVEAGVSDIPHIFWDCPKLPDYWQSIQKETELILGVKLTLIDLILGILPENISNNKLRYLL